MGALHWTILKLTSFEVNCTFTLVFLSPETARWLAKRTPTAATSCWSLTACSLAKSAS